MLVATSQPSLDWLDLVQALFRWGHLAAGVIWLGHLYFFNWVNAAFQAKLDAGTKQRINPELLPRALFWFRWGAAYTWLTGFFLLFLVYYHGPNLLAADADASLFNAKGHATPMAWLPGFLSLIAGFVVFDFLFKPLKTGTQQLAGAVVFGALVIGAGCALESWCGFSGRAVFVHIGALFGTVMAANVWMRIWPAQRRILTAVKAGQAPNPADVALAGARSRANTYMSLPLLLTMVSNHHATLYGGNPCAWQWMAAGAFVLGFAATYWLYKVAAKVPGF